MRVAVARHHTQAMKLLITGGGTGGHIFAGVAIAEKFKERHPDGEILFVGSQGGLEEKLVPRAGIPLKTLKLSALKGKSSVEKIKSLIKIPFALIEAFGIVFRFKPDAIIGVGGYASGPMVLAGYFSKLFGKKRIAILEQNAVSGLTNRWLSRFSDLIFCAFSGIESQFPGKTTIVTGNPVRKEMVRLDSPQGRFCVFIFGGSQGALGINSLILGALPLLKDLEIDWIHQTGERDFDRVKKGYESEQVPGRVEPFIYDMKACYSRSHLVVCRAGSSTLAELAAVGRASFLVPFPFAADNHQEKNARLFEKSRASRVFLQNQSTSDSLAQAIRALVQDPMELDKMRAAALALHTPAGLEKILDHLLKS